MDKRDAENLGYCGLGDRNQAGEEFLQFCATNQLIIMSTKLRIMKLHSWGKLPVPLQLMLFVLEHKWKTSEKTL